MKEAYIDQMKNNHYSEEEICSLYKKADIAINRVELIHQLTLLTYKEIIEILTNNNIDVPAKSNSKPKIKIPEIALRWYHQGLSDEAIIEKLKKNNKMKVSKTTISRWRKEHDLPSHFSTKAPGNKLDPNVIKQLLNDGKTDKEISLIIKCHVSTVGKIRIHQLGMKANHKR